MIPIQRHGALFGVNQVLLSIQHSFNFIDTSFISSFEAYLEEHPNLKPYFYSKTIQLGSGYTTELRKTYCLNFRGIQYILAARDIDVPVIRKSKDFRHFLENQTEDVLAKAILTPDIFAKYHFESELLKADFMTVAYLKTKGYSVFYIYDPVIRTIPNEFFQTFTKGPVIVYYPYRCRRTYGDSQGGNDFAYAIRDLSLIERNPPPLPEVAHFSFLTRLGLFSPPSSVETRGFHLEPEFFSQNLNEFKRDIFSDMIEFNLRAESHPSLPMP